jgi:prepilin-type N-terminal cleavage/methylation domain-containing protein
MARAQQPRHERRDGGFSLVELMMVVTMIGIMSSIALVSFGRYVKKSRTTEAANHLQKLWLGAVSYFETDHADNTGNMVPHQFPGSCGVSIESDCCNNPDKRCDGSSFVYTFEPWRSLTFNIADRHFYRPIFWACPDPTKNLEIQAWGDLDCDGTYAQFIRKGSVQANGELQGYTTPAVVNELE